MGSEEHVAAEVISACVGGVFSASALYPLEVLKTNMQASSGNVTDEAGNDDENDNNKMQQRSSLTLAKGMYKEGGLGAFYNGVTTSAFQSATEKALYFFAYSNFKNAYTKISSSEMGMIANLTLGCAAEWAHLPITLPIDCLTTKIQTNTDSNKQGAFALMAAMLSEKGVAGMYKGIQAYIVLCLKPSMQYTLFEQLKKMLLAGRGEKKNSRTNRRDIQRRQELSAMEAFFLGMFARTVATIAVFPYLRAKVMLQCAADTKKDHEDKSAPTSIPLMLVEMYKDGGLQNLFQGLGPELTRGVLSAALMLMVKEKITGGVSAILRGGNRV